MWFVGLILCGIYVVVLKYTPQFILLRMVACCTVSGVALVFVRYFIALGGNLLWGEGTDFIVRGPEPAFYSYFCDKGWRDYKRIVTEASERIVRDATWGIRLGVLAFKPASWFLALTIWALLLLMALPALCVAVLLGTVHLALTACASAFVYASGVALRLAEVVWRKAKRIEGRCGACHHPFNLPIYLCVCGARHRNFVPGNYGPLLRRCRCGRELRALLHLGRNRIASVCPRCDQPLPTTTLMVRELFVPIVGGVSAGKSSMMLASMVEFSNSGSGVKMTFPVFPGQAVDLNQKRFELARTAYSTGTPPVKTSGLQVQATQLCLEDRGGHRRLLFLYDAAGEIFSRGHGVGSQPYYRHVHGLVFLIDALPLMHRADGTSAREAPEDVFDQVVRTMIDYSGRRGIRNVPMAIVLTKCDCPGLLAQIIAIEAKVTPKSKPSTTEQLRSLAIREWLLTTGTSSVVRTAESYFRNVRYFAISALGRAPDASQNPFHPYGVLNPWAWLLRSWGLTVEPNQDGAAQ